MNTLPANLQDWNLEQAAMAMTIAKAQDSISSNPDAAHATAAARYYAGMSIASANAAAAVMDARIQIGPLDV